MALNGGHGWTARGFLAPGHTPAHIAGMVDISLNGEPRAIPPGQTVAALLQALGLDARKVAVERNEAIVVRSEYDVTALGAGDQLEIVHFIGGG